VVQTFDCGLASQRIAEWNSVESADNSLDLGLIPCEKRLHGVTPDRGDRCSVQNHQSTAGESRHPNLVPAMPRWFHRGAMVAHMKRNGTEVVMAPTDVFWGERFARVRDPFGHEWGITTRLHDMTPAEIQAAAAKLFKNMAD
jgi:hypothetical protein